MKCRATQRGFNGVIQVEPGDIFELTEEQAGIPPFPDQPNRYHWFEVLEGPAPQPAASAAEEAAGLTFSSVPGKFHSDDELPV